MAGNRALAGQDTQLPGALVITGPTASGKSAMALELARELDGEIISADSAQVYRGMDIGTAKPDGATLREVPHHLISIRHPADPFSAADFRNEVLALVPAIRSRGRVPIIAGGTMLYLKVLKEGLADLPEADDTVRQAILNEAAEGGWEALHRELGRVDPESARRIRPGDPQRLQRAIEDYRLTGIPLSELHRNEAEPCPFPLLEIAIIPPDRAVLHARIEARFTAMLQAGFVEEVAELKRDPAIHPGLPAMRSVGYRQIWSFLENEINEKEMQETALAATRQLAKRQFTWLRRWKGLVQLDTPDVPRALKITERSTILG